VDSQKPITEILENLTWLMIVHRFNQRSLGKQILRVPQKRSFTIDNLPTEKVFRRPENNPVLEHALFQLIGALGRRKVEPLLFMIEQYSEVRLNTVSDLWRQTITWRVHRDTNPVVALL